MISYNHTRKHRPHTGHTGQATGREGRKMKNIIDEVIRDMEHGIPRDEAINNAANIHAADYNGYVSIWAALNASIPT